MTGPPRAGGNRPRLRPGAEIAYEARHVIDRTAADARSRAFVADPATEF